MSGAASLEATARSLLVEGKGILAADESLPTIGKRFAALGIPSTPESHRAYREMLFTTPGLGEFISGAILFDETIRQATSGGSSMGATLVRQHVVPGIKVDGGTVALAGFAGEKITAGLDGLRERLAEYHQLGARFTKWRAVIAVDERRPSRACLAANAHALALFAALSQEADLVPIVEPEVLLNGDHTLARTEEVTGLVLRTVFDALCVQEVRLEGMLLKTGMVLPGEDCPEPAAAGQVAAATLRCLRRNVPAAVPGIVFLSGGQSELAATERLDAICRAGATPWILTFSFGRALQDTAMKTWSGSADKVAAAQSALLHRARSNSFATRGRYASEMERGPAEVAS